MIHNENNKYDETENNTHFVYFNEEIKIFYTYYNIYVKYKKTKRRHRDYICYVKES